MREFFRGGRGMSCGQGDALSQISRHYDRNVMERSNPAGLIGDNLFERLLRPLGRSRSDDKECEGSESRRTTFGLASPLLRLYTIDLPRFDHRFTTFASGILGQTVVKRWSTDGQTPKLVRSRYGSDQEEDGYEAPDLTPTVYRLSSAQVLPWFCFCSIVLRSARDRSAMRPRSSSENYRSAIGGSSEKVRTRSGLGRYQVGTLCDYLSPFGRYFIAPEAKDRQTIGKQHATNRQRITEEQANKYQTKPKQSPQKEQGMGRWIPIKLSSQDLAKTCLYTGYEQEIPKNGTRNVQGLHKGETINTQETPKRETRIRQESSNSTPKKLPERYCKGTGKVLNSGGKGTGEVLESYQRGTREVLTGSRSVVALEREEDCFGVVPTSRNYEAVVNDLRVNRSILRSFRVLCEDFRVKVESMAEKENRGRQIALKEAFGAKMKSKPFAYGLRLIALMIFCVLFSNPDLLGTSAMAQSPHRADIRQAEIMRLQIGDTIPEALWKMPIKVVNYPDGSDTILLKAYRSEPFILLDFWSTHCAPCIRALNEFNKIAKSIDGHLPILAMHVDSLQDLEKYVSDKGWKIPVVGVNESTIVNNYFFNRKQYGGLILIMDGIFYASPDSKVLNVEMFEQLLRGERPRFETKYPELLHSWRAEGEGRW